MLSFSVWLLLLLASTIDVLSPQRCIRITLALKDSRSISDNNSNNNIRNHHGGCCTECTSPRTSAMLTSALLRVKIRRGGGNSSNRYSDKSIRLHRNLSPLSSSTTTSSRSSGSTGSLPQLLSTKHGRRTACSLYIWNAPSALLYRWCHHLQRDNIYEGLGGKKVSTNKYCPYLA